MDDARRFARSEARCQHHGEVIVLGNCFCDIETFDGSRQSNVIHFDAATAHALGGVA